MRFSDRTSSKGVNCKGMTRMEPLIGDIEIRMRRLKTNHERLESLLKALNEPEVSSKIINVISILESFIDRHQKIDIREIYSDALNVHSLVSIEEIDYDLIERPSDHPKVIAQDRIISISNECLAIASAAKDIFEQGDQRIEVISSELIEKSKFDENIQQISSRIEDLESVLIRASQAEAKLKDSDRHLTKLSKR